MKKLFIIILLFISMCLWAQIPQTIDYQGRLADSDGNYLNVIVTVYFLIYDAETGGTALWSETHDVSTANGIFHVQLGSVTPLPSTLFDIAAPWLELIVGGETLSPRTCIASVPYAIKAEDADLLDGLNSSNFALSAHNHSAYNITSGVLDTSRYSAYSDLSAEGYLNNNSNIDLLTRDQGDTRWINTTGDTMTGNLVVPAVEYSSPRIHYLLVGEAEFVLRVGNDIVQRAVGSGGTYISSGGLYGLTAHVDVPVGARITNVEFGYFDSDANNMLSFHLMSHNVLGGGYSYIGGVDSSGSAGYGSVSLSTGMPFTTSDTFESSFTVSARTNTGTNINWPGSSLKITGARVTYELDYAP